MRRRLDRRSAVVARLLPLAAAAACGGSAPATASDALPFALAVRSDTPYITGAVTSRADAATGVLRVRVRAREGAEPSQARVVEADVTVHPDSALLWRDGRAARPADLTVGRAVTVWVRGPELRSMPPQVTGSAILVDR
jgi:hypothetical protein